VPSTISTRTFRNVGAAIVFFGIPTVWTSWADQGAAWAIVLAAMHLYLGFAVAFGLPWLRDRERAHPGAPPKRPLMLPFVATGVSVVAGGAGALRGVRAAVFGGVAAVLGGGAAAWLLRPRSPRR
jgi:hypothetical protein